MHRPQDMEIRSTPRAALSGTSKRALGIRMLETRFGFGITRWYT
jgi:hypothetical protein